MLSFSLVAEALTGLIYHRPSGENSKFAHFASHHQTEKSQFADDAGQWAVSKNIDLAAEYLQRDLDKLARWCAKWRIKLNPEKTKLIIFSKSRFAIRAEPALSLYGDLLSYYPQIKFLGITFDNRMTFTKHFEEILECCNQKFHRLRILVNKKWGPSPETILQIYKQCVRPIFEYGIVSTITVSETVITKIQRVQNSFIRLALRLLHGPDLPSPFGRKFQIRIRISHTLPDDGRSISRNVSEKHYDSRHDKLRNNTILFLSIL